MKDRVWLWRGDTVHGEGCVKERAMPGMRLIAEEKSGEAVYWEIF